MPSILLSSASVCLCNISWYPTEGREAHTHPELLLVRDSLSVCPHPSLFRVSVLWRAVGSGRGNVALRMLIILWLLGHAQLLFQSIFTNGTLLHFASAFTFKTKQSLLSPLLLDAELKSRTWYLQFQLCFYCALHQSKLQKDSRKIFLSFHIRGVCTKSLCSRGALIRNLRRKESVWIGGPSERRLVKDYQRPRKKFFDGKQHNLKHSERIVYNNLQPFEPR